MKRILFLCSGNYYRSRFAEILFNALAQEKDLEWRAESRGVVAEWSRNPGPIAEAVLDGLRARRISPGTPRLPMQLSDADLAQADRIVALYEREHRPLIQAYFPHCVQEIDYWDVPDLDEMDAETALARIEQNVRLLLTELQNTPVTP